MFRTALSRAISIKQCHASKFVQNVRYFSSEIDFDSLVKKSKVVVFMKGTPQSPMCGFSNTVVKILRLHGVKYDSYDVLSNEDMRKGIKEYTSWPTIPQVFINGEFIGGCDILMQMHNEKKLVSELEKVGIKSTLSEIEKEQKKTEKS